MHDFLRSLLSIIKSPGPSSRKMSPALWVAVLSILSPVSSVSIENGLNLISPSSSVDLPALQHLQYASAPLPWSIGSSIQSLQPPSSRLNLTVMIREKVNYECDNRLSSLLPTECREAWRQIPRFDGTMYSIGNRSADRKWDIPLPMRWPSSGWR